MVVKAAAVAALHVRAVNVLALAHLAQVLRALAHHAPAAMVNVAAMAAAKVVARVKGVLHVRRAQLTQVSVAQTRLTQGVVNRLANNRFG